MKILHITPWYPTDESPFEALWIQRIIKSLSPHATAEIWHVRVISGRRFKVIFSKDHQVNRLICHVPVHRWFFIEIAYLLLLLYLFLFRRIHKDCDLINFHIAYPILTYWRYLKRLVGKPTVLSEHWSAFHFNFGVARKLPRIQRIFKDDLPLIAVSESLVEDIRRFSGYPISKYCVIPNAIDASHFHFRGEPANDRPVFLMLSQWQNPKRPDLILRAFSKLIGSGRSGDCLLRIGGYGTQMQEMEDLVKAMNIARYVTFLGPLDIHAISREMRTCSAFLHATEYETFSVVCAEALCAGVPVIASKVGAIREYLNQENGIAVSNNTVAGWVSALTAFDSANFDRRTISSAALERFSSRQVGQRYYSFLEHVYAGF